MASIWNFWSFNKLFFIILVWISNIENINKWIDVNICNYDHDTVSIFEVVSIYNRIE